MQNYNATKMKPKTNKQNKNIETTIPLCLNHTLGNERQEKRKGKQKRKISLG